MNTYPTVVREDVKRAVIDYVNSSVELELHKTNIEYFKLSEEELDEDKAVKQACLDYFNSTDFCECCPGLDTELLIELMNAKVDKNVDAAIDAWYGTQYKH